MSDERVLPRRHPSVEGAEFEAEFVVLDPRVNRVHHLRELSAVVWDACDGGTSVDELVAEMHELMGADRAALRADVDAALELFAAAGLLEGTEPVEDPPPCLGCTDEHDGAAPQPGRQRPRRRRRQ